MPANACPIATQARGVFRQPVPAAESNGTRTADIISPGRMQNKARLLA
jgi:hypothetical protein